MARRGPKEITDAHKAAMAAGRAEGRAVKNYLEALEQHRPKRGRRRTSESINARLQKIEDELATADPMTRLSLVQERLDLTEELKNMDEAVDLTEVEEGFVDAAKSYSERKNISYRAWREIGVPPAVLKRAGITRAG
jgi:hypothetical protein